MIFREGAERKYASDNAASAVRRLAMPCADKRLVLPWPVATKTAFAAQVRAANFVAQNTKN
jgi:hypothetical protein